MRIPLSRIEYDYVFETFLQDLPPLLLQSGTLFSVVPFGSYTIKNSRLYFGHLSSEFIGKNTALFFEHKKRSIALYAVIQSDAGGCYAPLPDRAYAYDPNNQKGGIFVEIHIPEIPSITAQEH